MPLEKGSRGSIHKVRWGFSSIQSLSHVPLFANPWAAACQAFLSITNSWSLPKLMPIESVMHPTISSSVVPFSSHLQSFPALGSFQMSQLFASGGQSTGVSASTSGKRGGLLFPRRMVVNEEGVSENLLLLCHLKICHWISLVAQW